MARSKERINFDDLLKKVSAENLAHLHQQAVPLSRTAQLQAIQTKSGYTPIKLDQPAPDKQRNTAPYYPPKMGSSRVGAEDALKVPSLIFNQRRSQK